jgi:hypothetical protein
MQNYVAERFRPMDMDLKYSGELEGNPFTVQLYAELVGPNAEALKIPGFYKGNSIWCIRFSPLSEGQWKLRTVSEVEGLNGTEAVIQAGANVNDKVHGQIRINPDNRHHFIYEDGTPYFLMGYEIDWLFSLDQTMATLERTESLLDGIGKAGFNHIILNSYAYDCSWKLGHTSEFDFGPPALLPWEGEHGSHDYSKMNAAYWDHFDRVMGALYERGMVAHIFLKVYNKLVQWPETHSVEEQLFFDYIVARYQAFPNLMWDFSKEGFYELDYQLKADLLRRVKQQDAYHNLVTIQDDKVLSLNPKYKDATDFITDQNHHDLFYTVLHQRQLRPDCPILNAEFGYEHCLDDVNGGAWGWKHTPKELVERAYEVVMAGGYLAHYYTNHAWDIIKWDDMPQTLEAYRTLFDFFTSVPWTEMTPHPEFTRHWNSTRILADSELSEIILYAKDGNINVLAEWLSPEWDGFWMDIWTGERTYCQLTLEKGHGLFKTPLGAKSVVGFFTKAAGISDPA